MLNALIPHTEDLKRDSRGPQACRSYKAAAKASATNRKNSKGCTHRSAKYGIEGLGLRHEPWSPPCPQSALVWQQEPREKFTRSVKNYKTGTLEEKHLNRNSFVRANLRLVIGIMKKFHNDKLAFIDLIQEEYRFTQSGA